jgi:preprotein translocase subunit SecY
MNNIIQKLKNIWAIEDLRTRILNTILFLTVYVAGTQVLLPGINSDVLQDAVNSRSGSDWTDLINQFSGGAFSNASIFALGIMPYITASIVIQLLGMAVPQFQKLQKEGESGRKKMQTYTKFLTIAVTTLQAPSYLRLYVGSKGAIVEENTLFYVTSVAIMVSATLFLMWLGEKITEKGVGNGVSLLITIGILTKLPTSILGEFKEAFSGDAAGGRSIFLIVEFIGWFFIVLFTILIVKGVRKVPLEYPKQMVAGGAINKVQGGGRRYLPLKIAMAGVMPIIFAQAIMFLPTGLASSDFLPDGAKGVMQEIGNPNSIWYNITTAVLIVVMTYFYTAMVVNPRQMAEDFKKQGAFIPGVKPGNETADYIDGIMSKIMFPGSLFLALIAILPVFARMADIGESFSYFFGGTSLLIMVSVVLDTLQQIDGYLLMSHYDGLMKTGKVRGESSLSESSSVGMI